MKKYFSFSKKDLEYFGAAFVITALFFSTCVSVAQVYAASVTITATVATSLTFTTTTGATDQFGTITPGTFKYATTTLDTLTNDTLGYTVSLSGDNKNTVQNNMQLIGATSSQVTDQAEWLPGAATTTASNSVIRTALGNSQNVLAFRVMTASSTNSVGFFSSTWWGASDADGTAKFAGISSSTVQRLIGNAGTGSYSATDHLNTVQYYINVAATQPTGNYSAPLTYTAVGN